MLKVNSNTVFAKKKFKVALVVSVFNEKYSNELKKVTFNSLLDLGINKNDIIVFNVPGALESLFVVNKIKNNFDSVIVLGVVIKGDTNHYDLVLNNTSHFTYDIFSKSDTPVVFGVLSCFNSFQVRKRILTGVSFAKTAVEMMNLKFSF